MRSKVAWLALSGLLVAALLLASCTSAEPAGPTAAQTVTGQVTQSATQPATGTTTAPAAAVAPVVAPADTGPTYGGTLTRDFWTDPFSWDPGDASWNIDHATTFYMERLMIGDLQLGPRGTNVYDFSNADGIGTNTIATGGLAESWEVPSPSSIIFHLRQGIRYQDKRPVNGREFTSADVVYSMHRLKDSSKIGSTRFDWWDEWVAIDKYTVELKLLNFNGNWGYLIGWGAFNQIVAPELGDDDVIKDWRNAVGTGPFILADYVPSSSITYVKNPNYWGTTLIDGREYQRPFVDRIIVPFFPDATIRYAALRTGKVDIVQSVAWQEWDGLAQTNPELIFNTFLNSGGYVIPLRIDREPTNDRRIRLALSMALDREAMIETLFGGNGVLLNRPANTFETTVYTPLEELPPEAAEQFEYNVERARELLTEAGYPNGFTIEVMHYPGIEDLAALVKAQWEEIGVTAEINPQDNAVFYGQFYAKEHKNALLQWRGVPSAFVELRTASTTEQIWNPAMYDDATYQAMYDVMRFTTDDTERDVLIKELVVYLLSDIYQLVLPGSYDRNYWQPWVKNFYGEIADGYQQYGPILSHLYIDLDLRKELTGR